jgi:hypothetical protein
MIRKLTDADLTNLAGTTQKGYYVEGVRIMNGPFTDSDHYGYILGRNDCGNYVTWQFHYDDGELSVYWGHYFDSDKRDAALHNFNTRDLDNKPFKVVITETLKRIVEVEAKNIKDAEQLVSDNWHNSMYVLGADDFAHVKFEAEEEQGEEIL